MVRATHDRPRAGAVERRAFDLVEIRAERAEAGRPSRIRGHAAVFNKLSDPIAGGFRERIRPGAFSNTIRTADVRALFNHDTNYVLGRVKSGTLTLREDAVGLWFEAEPPDTSWASDLMVSIDRGDIDQASFGFRAIKDRFTQENGQTIRELLEVELFDVSPVTFPAYPQTDVQARSILAEIGIDPVALADILKRAERGWRLTSTDSDTIKSFVKILNRYLPDEPGQWALSEAGKGGRTQGRPLTILRRRLEIAEAELPPPPVIWQDHRQGSLTYREVDPLRVPERTRRAAEAVLRAASDDLGVRKVQLRWFEWMPAGAGQPAITAESPIVGLARVLGSGVPEAWVRANLSPDDAAATAAHECRHLYQQWYSVRGSRHSREGDAERYARRFMARRAEELAAARACAERKDPWYNW